MGESIQAGTPAASIICMPWSPYLVRVRVSDAEP